MTLIMKAVEFDKLPVKFKKQYPSTDALCAAGWWLQKKYDGCFGMAVFSGGEGKMLSRTGEDYTASCGHILKELKEAYGEAGWGPVDFVVLGEVWDPNEPFPVISGRMRRAAKSTLHFVANDLLPLTLETADPYSSRFADLKTMLPPMPEAYTHLAETWESHKWNNPDFCARDWKAAGGFDGAILRDPNAGYTIGLVKKGEIVKVKPTLSLDLRVMALFSEPGAKTGRDVFSIEVEYRGVRSRVGSGMPHDFASVPRVGQIVEIEAMDLTDDGKLREPRFKGIRHDKEHPDV